MALGSETGEQPNDATALDSVAYEAGVFVPPPIDEVEGRERSDKLRIAIYVMVAESKQGPHWARALWRYYMDGRIQREIAEEFGVTERTVARWLEDGREALKRILRERFGVTGLEDL
jgi:DNA-directed RNA polymerase specialized sigma24 family protein